MRPKRAVTLLAGTLLCATVAALLLGQVLGQPILLSFVVTDSMEAEGGIAAGDGFVAIPAPIAGDVSTGDVIVYDAEQIEGGGLVTHRVVDETDRGYVTRGDNPQSNPFTDQQAGEPPVQDAQVVAKALTIDGAVVTIPHLGTAVVAFQSAVESLQRQLAERLGTRAFLGTQGLAFLLFGLTVVVYAVDYLLTGSSSDRDRSRSRDRESGTAVRPILVVLALLVVAAATAAMVVPAGTQGYDVVSATFDSERPTTIPVGESDDLTYVTENAGLVPVYVYVEPASDGVATDPRRQYVGARSDADVAVTLDALPDETGVVQRFVREHRYLAVLPAPVVHSLHEFHPWAPIVAIDALLGGAVYALGAFVVGGSRGRLRNRSRERPGGGIAGAVRSLYR